MIDILNKQAAKKGLKPCLMFQDEARFGRMSDPSRCWAPYGMRPHVSKQLVREYTYAFAAIAPLEGGVDSLILPAMNRGCLNYFLKEISKRHRYRMILMIMDGAASHRHSGLKVPDNILIVYLPPYSPELNPVEHLWDDMREKFFCNRVFDSMVAVEKRLVEACNY